jgi:adenylate cyclase 3
MDRDGSGSGFADPSLEHLYQSYSVKQKRPALQCFLLAAILYDLYWLGVPQGQDLSARAVTLLFLVLNAALLAWCRWSHRLWTALPHLAWHLANLQVLAHLFLQKNEVTGRTSLGWVLLLDYLLYVTLPLRLRYCVMLSLGTCSCYLVAVEGLALRSDSHLVQQVITILDSYLFHNYGYSKVTFFLAEVSIFF